MRKQAHELNEIPTEFHEDGAPEIPVLPDEFNRFPKPQKKEEDRSRRRRVMLILAALGLCTLGILTPNTKEQPPIDAETVHTQETTHPSASSKPTSAVTPVSTPNPTPLPTPEPTPVPTPGMEAILVRSSLVYFGTVRFSEPDRIIEAGMRIWDPNIGETAMEHTFTREEIDGGIFKADRFDANGFYAEHSDTYGRIGRVPELLLETTFTYRTETGTEVLTKNTEAETVPWVNVNFDSEEDVGGILEWMYGTVYPNNFVVRVEEVPLAELRVVFGDDPDVLRKGEVLITITVDGTVLTGEFDPVDAFGYLMDGKTYYNFVFAVPVPDSFPMHGTAHIEIRQRLIDHEFLFEKEPFDITY